MGNCPREYQVKRLAWRESWREAAEKAAVDQFPWGALAGDDYRPVTSAKMVTDGTALFVFMETDETDLRAEAKGFSHVHTDSCMELFIQPAPCHSPQYMNFEFNSVNAMHLAIGTCRHDRTIIPVENYQELFQIRAHTHSNGWNLEFHIPLSFLRRFFPSLELNPGYEMRGNFYKSGDKTARPHYGCWSPINLPQPDFHCPDFFGIIKL